MEIKTATPEMVIVKLYEGALRFLRDAERHQEARAVALRATAITKALAIVSELQQSLDGAGIPAQGVFRELTQLIERLERRLKELVKELGWWADYRRCLSEAHTVAWNCYLDCPPASESAP